MDGYEIKEVFKCIYGKYCLRAWSPGIDTIPTQGSRALMIQQTCRGPFSVSLEISVLGKLRNKREEPVVGSDSVIQTLRGSFSSVSKPMLAKFVHFLVRRRYHRLVANDGGHPAQVTNSMLSASILHF